MPRSPVTLRILRGAAVGAAVGLLGALAVGLARSSRFDLLERAERLTYDVRAAAAADSVRAGQDVVLVLVDQESLDEVQLRKNRGWPWPRDFYAALLVYLRHAGARAIGFDLLFSEESVFGEEDDEAFAESLPGEAPVFLAFTGRPSAEGAILPDSLAFEAVGAEGLALPRFESGAPPRPILAERAAGAGSVVASTDPDGVIRRGSIGFTDGTRFFPSLSLRMAAALRGETRATVDSTRRLVLGGTSIPLEEDGTFLLRYPGESGSYPRYRISEILGRAFLLARGEEVDDFGGRLRGKVVLVGATAAGLHDVRATPLGRATPGTFTVAVALDGLLRGDVVRRTSVLASAGFAFASAFAIAFAVIVIPHALAAAGAAALVLAALVAFASLLLTRAGLWIDLAAPLSAGVVALAGGFAVSYATEGRQKKFIEKAFSRYLHPEFVRALVRDPRRLRLGGERREITVLFSDLAGFTSLSEATAPEELVALLNDYLTRMTSFILEGMGTVDKFIGDAIMSFWGAPLDDADHALGACRAAVLQARALERWGMELRARSGPELVARFGLATGPAVVGNLGSKDRFDFTAIGDTVNLASRLEGANKAYGTTILLADETARLAGTRIVARELDLLRVKGKKEPIRVHELLDLAADASEETRTLARDFAAALALYRARAFAEAESAFDAILARRANDGPSALYARRCRALRAEPPPAEWDGVFVMTEK